MAIMMLLCENEFQNGSTIQRTVAGVFVELPKKVGHSGIKVRHLGRARLDGLISRASMLTKRKGDGLMRRETRV